MDTQQGRCTAFERERSKIDKTGKIVPRAITGKIFTALLFKSMKWDTEITRKILGTLIKHKETGEKIFAFNLINAEAYIKVSAPSPGNPNRRIRQPVLPAHWEGHFGLSYEESQVDIVRTFEGMPEGYVKLSLQTTTMDAPDGYPLVGKHYAKYGSHFVGSTTLMNKIWSINWDKSLRFRIVARYNEHSNIAIFDLSDAIASEIPRNVRPKRRNEGGI